MWIVLHLIYCLIRGTFDFVDGKKSKRWAVVNSLFSVPCNSRNPPANLRMIVQHWLRPARTLLSGSGCDVGRTSSVVAFWMSRKYEQENYVRGLGFGEPTMVDLAAIPNTLAVPSRVFAAIFILAWGFLTLPIPFLFRSASSFERLSEIAHALLVASVASELKAKRVIYFGSFERNANLVAYLIETCTSAKVTRMCSPNPLAEHYTTCVCDDFLIATPLQIGEVKRLKEGWFVNTIRLWHPVGASGMPDIAYTRRNRDGATTLGVLSSGFWLRSDQMDFSDQSQVDAEQELHLCVANYLQQNPDSNVIIFPHPIEKRTPDIFRRACELYHSRIGFERVTILDQTQSTHCHFSDASLFVTHWSTSALEALYCGHKVIMFQPHGRNADQEFEGLQSVTSRDSEGLSRLLKSSAGQSTNEFFAEHGIEHVRHDWYPSLASSPIAVC